MTVIWKQIRQYYKWKTHPSVPNLGGVSQSCVYQSVCIAITKSSLTIHGVGSGTPYNSPNLGLPQTVPYNGLEPTRAPRAVIASPMSFVCQSGSCANSCHAELFRHNEGKLSIDQTEIHLRWVYPRCTVFSARRLTILRTEPQDTHSRLP